jgi:predicted transcriptional regulator
MMDSHFYITESGSQELLQRLRGLGIKKRSVLIMLSKQSKSFTALAEKTAIPASELKCFLDELAQIGLLRQEAGTAKRGLETDDGPIGSIDIDVNPEVIISKTKFLITDFCVDVLGANNKVLFDQVRKITNSKSASYCLSDLHKELLQKNPDKLASFFLLVRAINDTAAD